MFIKLGILCLMIGLLLTYFIDYRVLLALGFLYYAYKLQYKKEKLSKLDKIAVIALFILLLAELFLTILFTEIPTTESNSSKCIPNWVEVRTTMSNFGKYADEYCKNFCIKGSLHSNYHKIENNVCYCDTNNCNT